MKNKISVFLLILSFSFIYADSNSESLTLSEGGIVQCYRQIGFTIEVHATRRIYLYVYDLEGNLPSAFGQDCQVILVSTSGYYELPCMRVPSGRWMVTAKLYPNVWNDTSVMLISHLFVDFNSTFSVATNAIKTEISCIGCQDGKIKVTKTPDICRTWTAELYKDNLPTLYKFYDFNSNEDSYWFLGLPPGPYIVKFYYNGYLGRGLHSQYPLYINEPFEADLKLGLEGQGNQDSPLIYGPDGFDISNILDTAKVLLRSVTPPYNIVDSSVSALNLNGTGKFNFYNAVNGTPYYILVKHRNSLETWSASGVTFNSSTFNYDFSTSASQAYGNNMVLVNGNYCFYSGDVNQDGTIDIVDVIAIYNDANNFISGYVVTDLTGDSFVDASDLLIAYENSINYVSLIRP